MLILVFLTGCKEQDNKLKALELSLSQKILDQDGEHKKRQDELTNQIKKLEAELLSVKGLLAAEKDQNQRIKSEVDELRNQLAEAVKATARESDKSAAQEEQRKILSFDGLIENICILLDRLMSESHHFRAGDRYDSLRLENDRLVGVVNDRMVEVQKLVVELETQGFNKSSALKSAVETCVATLKQAISKEHSFYLRASSGSLSGKVEIEKSMEEYFSLQRKARGLIAPVRAFKSSIKSTSPQSTN
jgi:hypothetical protein